MLQMGLSENYDKLFCMEEVPKAPLLLGTDIMRAYTEEFSHFGLPNFSEGVAHLKDKTFYMCFRKNEFKKIGKAILDKMISDPEWFDKLNKTNYNLSKTLFGISRALFELDTENLTNKQISSFLKVFFEIKTRAHIIGLVVVVLEFEYQHYSNYMIDFTKKRIEKLGLSLDPNEVFNIMTTLLQKSIVVQEEIDILKLAKKIKENGQIRNEEIDKHFKKYRWINYMFTGPAYEKDYFIERIQGLIKSDIDFDKKTKELQQDPSEEHRKLEKELELDKKEKRLFEFGRRLMFTKAFRKDALVHGLYSIEKLLDEAAKRLGLSFDEIRFFNHDELYNAIEGSKFDKNELRKRMKLSTYIAKNGKETILLGKEAEEYVKDIFGDIKEEVDELKGMPACKGNASGIVRIINNAEDLSKMNQGDILISITTNPDLVPAMEKAAAIVTDVGGITCHAAIVAREMNTPCIIGTKIATKVFKNGDLVEVDANKGVVKKVKN